MKHLIKLLILVTLSSNLSYAIEYQTVKIAYKTTGFLGTSVNRGWFELHKLWDEEAQDTRALLLPANETVAAVFESLENDPALKSKVIQCQIKASSLYKLDYSGIRTVFDLKDCH